MYPVYVFGLQWLKFAFKYNFDQTGIIAKLDLNLSSSLMQELKCNKNLVESNHFLFFFLFYTFYLFQYILCF